ncbi:LOW QUALITY PROTEIN: uncharacterized protein LOC124266524 [Haliotis rubra]|uniref:LOW QUALITY PROTEIN: uncharacterized protein LOC124266524 n=1 Tax=Haliotis rubra TaxID=36100 RepID=UPI001EE59D7E|nr:LOW QUALITY PROTEIN: uncharacterized protein LOC124266524 [Haliotis rubra]
MVQQPPEAEPEPEPTPPVIKAKPAQIKAKECNSPAITPPATPPPEVLARIRAKRKRKLAIMLPTLLPSKLKGQSPGQKPNLASQAELNNNVTTSQVVSDIPLGSASPKPDVNSDYFDHIFDHDYCVNSPIVSPKQDKVDLDKFDSQSSGYVSPDIIVNVDEHVNEVVIDAGDTGELNSDVVLSQSVELEDGEVPESPIAIPTEHSKDSNTGIKNRQMSSKQVTGQEKNYRKRGSPGPDSDRYFDKIPAYFTTLSKPVKPPKKDKQSDQQSGIRREDFIARDSSPSRNEPGVFDKLPAYYSCFTNSTRYDQDEHETYDLEDLDAYPCAKKPRKQSSSRSRSRSRSQSRSRSGHIQDQGQDIVQVVEGILIHQHLDLQVILAGIGCFFEGIYSDFRISYDRSRSRSKSTSRSRSRSRSYSRSRSRSRSRPRSHSYRSYRSRSRSRRRSHSRSRCRNSSWARSRSRSRSFERRRMARQSKREEEKNRQIEERRIVYVGKIPEGYTRRELRKRFGRFGDIEDVSVHFREYGDNYGFVTFNYTCDAYAAIEQGNMIPGEKPFDLCFGGRRQFCDTDYADLDGKAEAIEEFTPLPSEGPLDFDQLLKQAQSKIKKKR